MSRHQYPVTSFRFSDDFKKLIKAFADKEGQNMTEFVIAAISFYIAELKRREIRKHLRK